MAVVKVETAVRYDGKTRKSITLKTEITDGQGQPVAEETSRLSLLAEDETVQTQRIYVRQPQLWSVDHPALYHCSVTLYDGGKRAGYGGKHLRDPQPCAESGGRDC